MEAIAIQLRRQAAVWQEWWATLTLYQKALPAVTMGSYFLLLLAIGGVRSDHVVICSIVVAGSYLGAGPRYVLRFLLPLLLTAMVYDSMRFYSHLLVSDVHVQEPYYFDLRFFGIPSDTGMLTPNEWFQRNTHPALDLITGFFYLTFVPIFVSVAAYFYFWVSRKGTAKLTVDAIQRLAPRVMWSFFWVNVAGYMTYFIYPAAPPWYVSLHGLGPALMDTLPNAAGCVRFDEILGTKFFTEWYGRSADVFGAIPSLHVAYPLQAVYFAFRFGAARKFSVFFYLIMCFSAVYLNHHYVLDVLLGSLYAIVASLMTEKVFEWRERRVPRAALMT